jgi:hypothetical protein
MHRFLAIFVFLAAAAVAQTNRGSISGTVTDPSTAVVPGAAVRVTNVGTNELRTTSTAANGTFSVSDLEPVEYRIEISAQGFKKEIVDNVKVDTASVATVNVKLETGSVDTKVTVQASAVMIDTESGTLSNTVNTRQIEDAPLLNRSVLDLALTLPNVTGDAGSVPRLQPDARRRPAHEHEYHVGRHEQYRRLICAHDCELHAGDGAGIYRADVGLLC